MASARLQQLTGRIAELRNHLLPVRFSEVGDYEDSDKVTVQTLSFRVLVHAEIEAYFEDRVVEIAKTALASWKRGRHISRPLLYLVAFSGGEMHRPPESLTAPSDNKRKEWRKLLGPAYRLQQCIADYVKAVQRENHGIQERNMLSMLLPIGVDHWKLDPVLLAELDSFGRRRGEAAHTTSSPAQVRQAPDPKAELTLVERLLGEIAVVDGLLDELLKCACLPQGEPALPGARNA